MDKIIKSLLIDTTGNNDYVEVICNKGMKKFLDSTQKAIDNHRKEIGNIISINDIHKKLEEFYILKHDELVNRSNLLFRIKEDKINRIYIAYELNHKQEIISLHELLLMYKMNELMDKHPNADTYSMNEFSNIHRFEIYDYKSEDNILYCLIHFKE